MGKKIFFLILLFWLLGCSSDGIVKYPTAGQVGMYPYRNKGVMGYDVFDSAGQLKRKIIIKRDERENIVEKFQYDASGKLKVRYVCEVNRRGLMQKRVRLGPDAPACSSVSNILNALAKERDKRSPEGNIQRYSQYYYDEEGLLKEQKNYTAESALMKSYKFYYNNFGERIRKETFDATDKLTKIIVYIFDSQNRRIKNYTLSEKGEIKKSSEYLYYSSNNAVRINYMDGLDLMRGYVMIAHDEKGNRTETKRYDEKGILKTITRYYY